MPTTETPRRMTRAELAKVHADFKATIDGRPYVLADCGAKGTCLVPVEIVEAPARPALETLTDRELEREDDDRRNYVAEVFGA